MNAATTMMLALVPAGGHIVTTTDCYRRTRQFIQTVLPKMGITATVSPFNTPYPSPPPLPPPPSTPQMHIEKWVIKMYPVCLPAIRVCWVIAQVMCITTPQHVSRAHKKY